MQMSHGNELFETVAVENRTEGWSAIDLFSTEDCKRICVVRITFWDAMGDFTVETFGGIVPLSILEKAINEARASVELPHPRQPRGR